ncbi:MAG: hypothetical protein WCL11_05510 [Verrucomicrobiota bacterium]
MKRRKTDNRLSASELSELSGFDRRTIKAILGGRPGPYTLADFCAGVRRHYTGKVIDQRERRARLSADLLELELYERTGALMPTADAGYYMQNLSLMLRSRFTTLTTHVCQFRRGKELSDTEFEQVVDDEVRKALEDCAKGDSYDAPQASPGGTILLADYASFTEKLLAENTGARRWSEIYEKAHDKDTTANCNRETSPAEGRAPATGQERQSSSAPPRD